jgi:hypothetical protein
MQARNNIPGLAGKDVSELTTKKKKEGHHE